jgi:hypothetical protein
MEIGVYHIYEILENGMMKKASHHEFRSKEAAERSIIRSMYPLDRKRLITVKAHG